MKVTLFVLLAAFAALSSTSATKCYFCYGKGCLSVGEDRLKDCSRAIDYIQQVMEKLKIPKLPEGILENINFECLSAEINLDGQYTKIKTCAPLITDKNFCEILEAVAGKELKVCKTCDQEGCNKT